MRRAVQGGNRIWESLWVVTVVALLVRLAAIGFLYRNTWNPGRDFWLFGFEVGRIARSVAEGKSDALRFISEHPWTFVFTSLRRVLYTWTGFWSFKPRHLEVELHDPANIFFTVPLTLLMVIGLWQAFRKAREVALPYAYVLAFYPLVYYVTHPGIRYRHVIDPEIVILAVLGAMHLLTHTQEATQEGQPLSP